MKAKDFFVSIMFFFFFTMVFNACEKDITNTAFPFYLRYMANGEFNEYYGSENPGCHNGYCEYIFVTAKGSGNDPGDSLQIQYTGICNYTDTCSFPSFEVSFIYKIPKSKLYGAYLRNHSDFTGLFTSGNKKFCTAPLDRDSFGVVITYTDEEMTEWSTSKYRYGFPGGIPANIDYNAFMFKVISAKDYITTDGDTNVLVNSVFNCTLFNDSGDSIVIRYGEMSTLISEMK